MILAGHHCAWYSSSVNSRSSSSSSSSSRRDGLAEARPMCETGPDSEAEAEIEAEIEAGAHADVSLGALDKDMVQELAISDKARTSVEDGADTEGDAEGDEDEDDAEADAAAMGESDDEEPQPCPLARAYLEEQRVSNPKRKHA